jgi:hypothetical protein
LRWGHTNSPTPPLGWPQTLILPISTSWVAGIICMYYHTWWRVSIFLRRKIVWCLTLEDWFRCTYQGETGISLCHSINMTLR